MKGIEKTWKKAAREAESAEYPSVIKPVAFDKVISTGSTLLDLAISGGRVRGGGIPGGTMSVFYGPSGCGKTAILSECMAYAQARGGMCHAADPEGRYTDEHRRIYNVRLKEGQYSRPKTIQQLFDTLNAFIADSANMDAISVFAGDSLAALSSEKEIDVETGDAEGRGYGTQRALDFSYYLRMTTVDLHNSHTALVCSNQVRQDMRGRTYGTGGNSILFYSDVQVELGWNFPQWKIKKTRKGREKVVGIITKAEVVKSSLDDPFRRATLYIVFGYGVDDVMGNLQWYKDVRKDTRYGFSPATHARSLEESVKKTEAGNFQSELREAVIDLWMETEKEFRSDRKPKIRE